MAINKQRDIRAPPPEVGDNAQQTSEISRVFPAMAIVI
jgi:hypothetical protein